MMLSRARTPKAEELIKTKEETDIWYKFMLPFMIKGFNRGVNLTSKTFPSSNADNVKLDVDNFDETDFDVLTVAAKATVKQQTLQAAAIAVGTTEKVIQTIINDAVQDDLSSSQLSTIIGSKFNDMKGYRSLRLARTELTGSMNNGSVTWMKGAGYSLKKWFTTVDGRERESHRAVNGDEVGVNEKFIVGGYSAFAPADSSLPAEERMNCRCAILAAGVPVDRLNGYAKMFLRLHGSLERQFVKTLEREFNKQKKRVLQNLSSLDL